MAAALLLAMVPVGSARAEWLPAGARAVPVGDSASPDAPAPEVALGTTEQLSLGGELALRRSEHAGYDLRWSVYGLAALEVQLASYPPPAFLRALAGMTWAWAFKPEVAGGRLEVALGVGGEWATTLGATEQPTPAPGDIPFGGSGLFALPEIAWGRDLGPWEVKARLGDRVDLPGLLLAVDQRVLADVVADALQDSFVQVPMLDVTLRFRGWPGYQPVASVHGEVLLPEDTSASSGGRARALLGLAIASSHGELIPFIAGEVGNGEGMLINQHTAGVTLGARFAAF